MKLLATLTVLCIVMNDCFLVLLADWYHLLVLFKLITTHNVYKKYLMMEICEPLVVVGLHHLVLT